MILAGLGLLLVGFGFKISAVPFHMWAPDVYQGAPTSVTALIATGSKAAAFAALLRVLIATCAAAPGGLDRSCSGSLAALTMTVGNVVALAQSNVKRMLAYSSIAHVGYMLVGLVAGRGLGSGSVLFYLLGYTVTTAGAFGTILLLERAGEEAVRARRLRRPRPRAIRCSALGLTVFLLSPGRHPAHGRVRGQVLPVRRGGEVGLRRGSP